MKKVLLLFVVIFLASFVGGCWVDAGPGEAGVRVNLLGDKRGVEEKAISTGRISYNNFTQEVIIYQITEQTWAYSATTGDGSNDDQSFTANSMDSLKINFDAQISFHIDPEKLPKFYSTYLVDLPGFINTFLRNSVRDAFVAEFSKRSVENIMGPGIPEIGFNVCKALNEKYDSVGVEFTSVSIINSPRPPKEVADAIANKAASTQNALAAVEKVKEAEQLRQANQKTAQALTPLLIQKMWIETINPNVQVIYIPNNSNLFMGAPSGK